MTEMTSKVWNKLLDIELIIGMIVSIIIGIVGESLPQLYWSRMCWIALTILLLNFILKIWGKNKHSIKIASQWLGSLTLILIFNFLIYTTTSMLNLMVKPLVLVSSIVGIVLLLLVDIPVVVVNFPVVKNWFMRLFMIFILYLNYSYNVNRFLGTSGVIKAIIRSGVIIALATFILAFFITRAWQLKFQWNLKLGKSKNFQWLALILLLTFSVWFAFFNSFVTLAPSLADLLCFWQWDFSTFEVTLNSVLAAIEAGIFEETLRYLNLVILLVAMRNFKYRMIFAIVISSILFSLSHLGNLGISTFLIKFDLETTLQQVVYTFGAGMLFAVIYLYTGKLWLSISIHGLVDLIALSETPLTRIVSPLITDGWISAIIILLIPLVVALLMMTGKRKTFMGENVGRIIAVS
ncbi:CPBP family intramembrane glutamic endopeptidase [Lactobacillus crispatus]|nr:CPBP family intramembrane glutamic endopeptidase [Lactobacillus crispatus]